MMSCCTWFSILYQAVVLAAIYWLIVNHKFILNIIKTLPRDSTGIVRLIKVTAFLLKSHSRNLTVWKVFERLVEANPSAISLLYEDQKWSRSEVDKYSNKVANYFLSQGYKKGDIVAIFMENRPEFVCIWLGLSKIGVIASLINYNLRQQPLKHCIEMAGCKTVIFNEDLGIALEELREQRALKDTKLYYYKKSSDEGILDAKDFNEVLLNVSDTFPKNVPETHFSDPLLWIFTSGTTGLPKACVIKHSRFFMVSAGNYYMHGLRESDVMYTSLPLYHGAGTMLGGGQVFCFGVCMVVKKKFSASNFWKDCIKYKVTAAQYIGEICRYLLCQPPSPNDNTHNVRVMFGNGLRAEIWSEFVNRFNIPHISEFYGSTEGNSNIVNIDNKVGAIGFVPLMFLRFAPVRLIRVDADGEPIRDPQTGFCIPCQPNEPGEFIGQISKSSPISDFEGYADKKANQSKILENVFRKNDQWFRSGDILVMDELAYFYFRDRKGDTFRWKGENCSTAEVESIISTICDNKECVVYGVQIPGSEGRAGMAAINDPDHKLNLTTLASGLAKSLPAYARPLFVRVLDKIDITGTYKLKKLEYQQQGYDITQVKDKIYFLSKGTYVELDENLHNDILSKKLSL